MIIFYPTAGLCTPVIIADMTDSSDRWGATEAYLYALLNMPSDVILLNAPNIYSCKYEYSIQHNGVPLGAALKMTMNAAVSSPPSELISRVSVDYVASAVSIDQMSNALAKYANPQLKVMTAVVVERTASPLVVVNRSFVAYSVVLQPDAYGTNATLYIRAASLDDTLVKSELGFQLSTLLPLSAQLTALGAKLGYICSFAPGVAVAPPVSGRLFQPSTLTKILDEICLQNKIVYKIANKIISFYSQSTAPIEISAPPAGNRFSFLGYGLSALMWGVGVENYANVKFKTPIFNALLFDKITIYNDSMSALFEGFKSSRPKLGPLAPAAYDAYILRYTIERNDAELCCEVTATNNWLLAQTRIDGILESKIYGALL